MFETYVTAWQFFAALSFIVAGVGLVTGRIGLRR